MREPCFTVQFLHSLIGSIKKKRVPAPNTISCIWFFRFFCALTRYSEMISSCFSTCRMWSNVLLFLLYRFLPSTLSFTAYKFFGDNTCAQNTDFHVQSISKPYSAKENRILHTLSPGPQNAFQIFQNFVTTRAVKWHLHGGYSIIKLQNNSRNGYENGVYPHTFNNIGNIF